MADAEEFPFYGSVMWLTPEQGGRRAGRPQGRAARASPGMALLRGHGLRSATHC